MWFVPCFHVHSIQLNDKINKNKIFLKTETDGWGAEDDLNWEDENTWW